MTHTSRFLLLGALMAASAGCNGSTSAGDPSWLRADVVSDGAANSFSAEGRFMIVSEGGRREFGISAVEPRHGGSALILHRRGGLRPAPGEYSVGLLDYSDPASRGMGVIYGRTVGGIQESFSATSGVVRIQESTRERVAGTFDLEVARYCAMGPDIHSPCPMAWNPPADAPTLRVTGEFSVVYDDGEVEPLPWEVPIPGT
jgi:hypothetical protein